MTLPQGSEHCVNVLYEDYDSTYQKLNRERINDVLDKIASEKPDLTVAMLHWGSEYNDTISESQEQILQIMQSNGVDAVIGTHAHRVQQMVYDPDAGTFVAYCLGDLIGDAPRAGAEYSVLLDLQITKSGEGGPRITGYDYTPIYTVREEGKPVNEAADLLIAATDDLCEYFTVDDLMFLKRTGRLSGAGAMVGTMLGIKPILRGDEEGHIVACQKIRGRKKAVEALIKIYSERVVDPQNQRVGITHGDCPEEARELAEKICAAGMPGESGEGKPAVKGHARVFARAPRRAARRLRAKKGRCLRSGRGGGCLGRAVRRALNLTAYILYLSFLLQNHA
jgi:hypothetical protein